MRTVTRQAEQVVNHPDPDRSLAKNFCEETLGMLDRVEPLVRELVRSGGKQGDAAATLERCFSLAHSLKGSAAFLRYDHLAKVAAAAEQFAAGLRSSSAPVEASHLLLLHDVCTLFRQGIELVRQTGGDDQLAVAAAELAARLLPAEREPAPGPDDDGDLEGFIGQVDGLMQVVERELLLWDLTSVDPGRLAELIDCLEELTALFAHRRYTDLERICRAMANVLRRFHGGEVFQGEYPDKVFLGLVDVLYEGIDAIAAGGDGIILRVEEHLETLQAIMRQPIGELLIRAGLVDPRTVEQALRIQEQARARKKTPKRLGDLLVAMGEVSSEQVDRAIRAGRACPVPSRSGDRQGDRDSDGAVLPVRNGVAAAAGTVAVDREKLQRLLEHLARLEKYRPGMEAPLQELVNGLLRQAEEMATQVR